MAKTQDVITELTKNQRHEKGRVVGYKCENNTLKIQTQLTSIAKGNGDLKLSKVNDQPSQEVVLNQQNVAGSRKICEYEIHSDNEGIRKIITDLNLENIVGAQDKLINDEALLAFFEKECDLVHREIENIKACRTSLYMGTLGILGAAGIAILGIIGTNGGFGSVLSWLPWASAIPVLLLTTAIITLIHKARGLNERIGYLEAIEEFKNSHSLGKIKGWFLSKSTNRQCKIFQHIAENSFLCPKDVKNEHCIVEARDKANKEINQHVKLLPDLLNSFTSLCTYVYSVAYLIAVGAFLWATITSIKAQVIQKGGTNGINDYSFWVAVLCGTIITAIIAVRTFKMKQISSEKSKWEYILKWVGHLSPVIIFLLVIGLIASFRLGSSASWIAMLAYIIGGFISAIAVVIAYFSLEKINSLRRGCYSIDCWRHTWKIRFERCPLMNS